MVVSLAGLAAVCLPTKARILPMGMGSTSPVRTMRALHGRAAAMGSQERTAGEADVPWLLLFSAGPRGLARVAAPRDGPRAVADDQVGARCSSRGSTAPRTPACASSCAGGR